MSQREEEQKTLALMIQLYCHDHHDAESCEDCEALLQYAQARVSKCPFADDKGPCSKCKVHCFQEPHRTKIREVMKYAGPRMMLKHPKKAIKHLWQTVRKREQ